MGVWLMQADGSQRHVLGNYGRPKWSPDSRQFFIVDFDLPRDVTLMDIRPDKERSPADRRTRTSSRNRAGPATG